MSNELNRNIFSWMMLSACRIPRLHRRVLELALRLEGGGFFSWTGREIMRRYYSLEIGSYSYGSCFIPNSFPSGTVIGRYVSIAEEVRAFGRNHPIDRPSTHPAFFNANLGYIGSDNVPVSPVVIGHDSWIGFGVSITPKCNRIGVGAIVGAGSVVTKDIPDFAVVAGNPAKIIKQRFSDEACSMLMESEWWLRSLPELVEKKDFFTHPLTKARIPLPRKGTVA